MSMAFTAVALGVVAIGTGAYSTYAASENAKEMGDYNQKAAENAALDAAQRGAIEASQHRQKVRQMISTQNAAYSSAGVEADTGTALQVQTDTAGFGELDALRILNNAQRQAAGYRAQGDMAKWQGDAAFSNGMFTMAGDAAGGLSALGGGMKKAGMFDSAGTSGGGKP